MSQIFPAGAARFSAAAVGAARLPNRIPKPRRATLDWRKLLRFTFIMDGRAVVDFRWTGDVIRPAV
jgi:hypothetical protein